MARSLLLDMCRRRANSWNSENLFTSRAFKASVRWYILACWPVLCWVLLHEFSAVNYQGKLHICLGHSLWYCYVYFMTKCLSKKLIVTGVIECLHFPPKISHWGNCKRKRIYVLRIIYTKHLIPVCGCRLQNASKLCAKKRSTFL